MDSLVIGTPVIALEGNSLSSESDTGMGGGLHSSFNFRCSFSLSPSPVIICDMSHR